MDVLTVGGKEYVKASVIARDLGYTADYVGQLCRARKVNAKLVGRSWYVDSSSIEAHKGTRYRSTQAQSVKQLKEELRGGKNTVHVGVIEAPSHFYAHNTRKEPAPVSYEPDEAELIPTVSKSKSLPIELADAKPLSIEDKSNRYHFTTPKVPEVKFQGTLQVTDYESEEEKEEATSDNAHHIRPHVSKSESNNKAQKIAISAARPHFHQKISAHKTTLTRPATIAAAQVRTEHVEVELVEGVAVSKWALLASFTASTALVVLFFGLEANVFVQGEVAQTTYTFGIDNLNLSASVYDAADSFSGMIYLIKFSTNLFGF